MPNTPLTRDRLRRIMEEPDKADPYDVQQMAAYTFSAYTAMDGQPPLHEGNHCECALHLKAILQRSMMELPVIEKEVQKYRGGLDEMIGLCTSCVDVNAPAEVHELARAVLEKCLEIRPPDCSPSWFRHKWEQEVYEKYGFGEGKVYDGPLEEVK